MLICPRICRFQFLIWLGIYLQMDDPLTALMYAVQVMNFLKTLIEKTLREREDSVVEPASVPDMGSSDDNGNQSCSKLQKDSRPESNEETIHEFVTEGLGSDTDEDYHSYSRYSDDDSDESVSCGTPLVLRAASVGEEITRSQADESKSGSRQAAGSAMKIDSRSKGTSNVSRINSMTKWFEAWR